MITPMSLSRIFIVIALGFCFSLSYGQDSSAVQKQSGKIEYFKIEVGMGIMGCPVLPVRLKEKISALKGVDNYHSDMTCQCILFNVPEGVVTTEEIKTIAISCSFPPTSINVLMGNKPFVK